MKNLSGFILAAMLFASTGAAAETKTFPEVRQFISLTDLTVELSQEMIKGMHPDMAIECKEGTLLPIHFLSNYGIFSIEFKPQVSIHIDQHCYLRFIKKKPYLSFDLMNWEKAKNFFKGKPAGSVKISEDKSHILVETHLEPYAEGESEFDWDD